MSLLKQKLFVVACFSRCAILLSATAGCRWLFHHDLFDGQDIVIVCRQRKNFDDGILRCDENFRPQNPSQGLNKESWFSKFYFFSLVSIIFIYSLTSNKSIIYSLRSPKTQALQSVCHRTSVEWAPCPETLPWHHCWNISPRCGKDPAVGRP